jgi:hypothetical protein
MVQKRVRRQQDAALKGKVADYADADIVSRVNKYPQQAEQYTVTVDTANDDTVYSIEVSHVTVEYTSGSGATTDSIRDGLLGAIENEPLVTGVVIPSEGQSSDTLVLTAVEPGVDGGFDFTETDSNLSSSQTQSPTDAAPIPFGRAVMDDGLAVRQEITASQSGSYGDGAQFAHLLDGSELTDEVVEIEVVTYDNAGTYYVSVDVAGSEYSTSVDGSGQANADDVADAIAAGINAELPANTVDAQSDLSGSESLVVLTAEVSGLGFDVEIGTDSDSSSDLDIFSDNRSGLTSAADAMLGVSAYDTDFEYPRQGASGDSEITKNEPFAVLKEGRVWVDPEDSPSEGDYVWVRVEAAGGNSDIGRFRASEADGCVRVSGAKWAGTADELGLLHLEM